MTSEPAAALLLESDADPGELVNRYPHVTNALLAPWAITEEMKNVVVAIAARRIAGEKLSPAELSEVTDGREAHREPFLVPYSIAPAADAGSRGRTTNGSIAVLPLYGVMAPRLGLLGAISGGASVESFMRSFKSAMNDPQVSGILIDIDSPGGSTGLIAELGDLIFDARGEKPIAAVSNTMAGSAAYWVAAQVDELACTPSGTVGSIGVYGMHTDISRALEKAGVDVTVISAGAYKTELQPYGPLSDDAREYAQGQVDAHHLMFKEAVARGRGTTAAKVGSDYGEGRMLMAKPALAAGMIDRIATFDQMLERLARGQVIAGKPSSSSRRRAAAASGRLELRADDSEPMIEDCPECEHEAHDGPCPEEDCDCVTYGERQPEGPSDASAAALDAMLEGATLDALAPGSTLVLNLGRSLNTDEAERLHAHVARALEAGGHRLVVVDPTAGRLEPSPQDPPEPSSSSDVDQPSPADAGEHRSGSELLQRRAVRAALRTPPKEGQQ